MYVRIWSAGERFPLETKLSSVSVQKVYSVTVLDEITRQVSVDTTDLAWVSLALDPVGENHTTGTKLQVFL